MPCSGCSALHGVNPNLKKPKHFIQRLLSKHHNIVEYLSFYLDSNLNGKSVAHKVLKKINAVLNFL